eukprot:TRINITY_DN11172_c0_g1_i3.p1 TRINITY_DN11172_c0_g1~~TRINITY_DN11172_c0_g1_i3.p1  ORF type:complete len:656 (-),score=159.17 TRINITY_DN11172_c0_g1_i3:745-2712(-)
MKAKVGWSSFRNLLMETAGVEYHKYAGVIATLAELRAAFDDKMNNDVLSVLGQLSEKDVDQVKQMKNNYDQTSSPYLQKQKRFLGTKTETMSPGDAVETERDLANQKKLLDLTRLDLGTQIESLETLMMYRMLKATLDCLKMHFDFFMSGKNLLESFEKNIQSLEVEVSNMKTSMEARDLEIQEKRRALEDSSSANIQEMTKAVVAGAGYGIRDLDVKPDAGGNLSCSKEGYLYVIKDKGQGLVQKRVWCVVDSGKLSIHKKKKFGKTFDLLLCTVKEARDLHLRYCFQIISPTIKSTFQAISAREMEDWMTVIQNSISNSLNSQPSKGKKEDASAEEKLADLRLIQEAPENRFCADCKAENPDWASKNLGIMICKSCSGIHRGLGAHITKVRSVTLDKLDKFLLKYIRDYGNKSSNSVFLAELDEKTFTPPTFASPRADIEKFIAMKYKEKKWTRRIAGDLNVTMCEAVMAKDYVTVMTCLQQGADINFQYVEEENRAPLHEAINKVDLILSVMLVENGAALDALEDRGWTPLHYASYRDSVDIVELLLLHKASIDAIDQWGLDPLTLSLKYESANVVGSLKHASNSESSKKRISKGGQSLSLDLNNAPDLPPKEFPTSPQSDRALDGALRGITEGRKTKIEKFFTGIFKKDKD